MKRFTEEEQQTIWDMREAGVPVKRIANHLDRQNVSLRKFIADHGGRRPTPRQRSELRLSLEERAEISGGLAARPLDPRDRGGTGPLAVDGLSGGERQRWQDQVPGSPGRPRCPEASPATQAGQARPVPEAPFHSRAQARGSVVTAADLGVVG